METWHQPILLTLCLFFSTALEAATESAPEIYQPDEDRIVLHEADINANDFEIGTYFGLIAIQDFGTNSLIGLTMSYHISENYFVTANIADSTIRETSFQKLTNISITEGNRDYAYYDLGMGYNLFQGESFFGQNHAFNSSFYITAAVGSTKFASDSYHTLAFGFGYKVVFLDWLSVQLGAKDRLFRSDIFAEKDELFHNIELHTGINIIF